MRKRQFGVSTRLHAGGQLVRDHLIEIASYGFELVELAGHAGHLDYGNPAAVAELQQWLAEARLALNGIAVPAGDAAENALLVSRRIPMNVLVVAVGPPREARRAVERLSELAAPLGVRIAVDSRSPSMTPIGSLVHFVDGVETACGGVGICLDFGSADRRGELVDAIEMSAEHLVTARIPIESRIDWASTLTTVRKIGYEGPFLFDATGASSTKETLARAREAREKMQQWLEFT